MLEPNVGFVHELGVINGRPALAYRSGPKYMAYAIAKSANPQSPSDWLHSFVDDRNQSGLYCSLWEVDGTPGVGYQVGKTPSVKRMVAYAKTADPTNHTDWSTYELDIPADYNTLNEYRIINGILAALAQDKQTKALYYLYTDTGRPTNTSKWTASAIQNKHGYANGSGQLLEINGMPCAVYITDIDSVEMAIAGSVNPAASNDWEIFEVDSNTNKDLRQTGLNAVYIDGLLHVTAENLDPPQLLYYRCEGPEFKDKSLWEKHVVFEWFDYSSGTNLTSFEDKPLIGYSFWAQAFVVEPDSNRPNDNKDWQMYFANDDVGEADLRSVDLVEIDGKVVFSYYNFNPDGLHISIVEP